MHERNSQSSASGLFADKGQAEPTRDFVPRLKTDEPAQIEPPAELIDAHPEAKPLSDTDGLLGGLIRRRTEPQRVASQSDQTAADAARAAERETAEITRSISEHIDNGMLYESLKLGLPLPKLDKAMANSAASREEPKSFGEAALQRLARPTTREPSGTDTTAHAGGSTSERKRARKTHQNSTRRQLTARLSINDFERFKHYAEDSGRTYQDILSTATTTYLDDVAGPAVPVPASAEATETAERKPDPETASTSPAEPVAVKSPYDWFGSS